MATTQYIGARYVPLFFTNPDDSSNNWKAGVVYDPLTVVTDLNQSYTSKIPVPASVGRPSENPTYWILTGAYSAQVEQYRQEVEEVKTEIDDLDAHIFNPYRPVGMKKVIFIADSYGTQYSGLLLSDMRSRLNISEDNFYSDAAGSIGFAHANNNQTFLTLLQNIKASMSAEEIAEVTHIIVVGGANDTLESESAVETAIDTFSSYCRNNFPNALFMCGFVGVKFNWTENYKYGNTCAVYRRIGRRWPKSVYLSGVEYILHRIAYMQSDGLHPNETGITNLVAGIVNAVLTGSCDVAYPIMQVGSFGNVQNRAIYMQLDNGEINLFTNNFIHHTFTDPVIMTANGSNAVDLVTLDTMGYASGSGYQIAGEMTTIFCKQASAQTYTPITGFLEYSNGVIKWHPILFGSTSTTPGEITFNEIYMHRFCLRMQTAWN